MELIKKNKNKKVFKNYKKNKNKKAFKNYKKNYKLTYKLIGLLNKNESPEKLIKFLVKNLFGLLEENKYFHLVVKTEFEEAYKLYYDRVIEKIKEPWLLALFPSAFPKINKFIVGFSVRFAHLSQDNIYWYGDVNDFTNGYAIYLFREEIVIYKCKFMVMEEFSAYKLSENESEHEKVMLIYKDHWVGKVNLPPNYGYDEIQDRLSESSESKYYGDEEFEFYWLEEKPDYFSQITQHEDLINYLEYRIDKYKKYVNASYNHKVHELFNKALRCGYGSMKYERQSEANRVELEKAIEKLREELLRIEKEKNEID